MHMCVNRSHMLRTMLCATDLIASRLHMLLGDPLIARIQQHLAELRGGQAQGSNADAHTANVANALANELPHAPPRHPQPPSSTGSRGHHTSKAQQPLPYTAARKAAAHPQRPPRPAARPSWNDDWNAPASSPSRPSSAPRAQPQPVRGRSATPTRGVQPERGHSASKAGGGAEMPRVQLLSPAHGVGHPGVPSPARPVSATRYTSPSLVTRSDAQAIAALNPTVATEQGGEEQGRSWGWAAGDDRGGVPSSPLPSSRSHMATPPKPPHPRGAPPLSSAHMSPSCGLEEGMMSLSALSAAASPAGPAGLRGGSGSSRTRLFSAHQDGPPLPHDHAPPAPGPRHSAAGQDPPGNQQHPQQEPASPTGSDGSDYSATFEDYESGSEGNGADTWVGGGGEGQGAEAGTQGPGVTKSEAIASRTSLRASVAALNALVQARITAHVRASGAATGHGLAALAESADSVVLGDDEGGAEGEGGDGVRRSHAHAGMNSTLGLVGASVALQASQDLVGGVGGEEVLGNSDLEYLAAMGGACLEGEGFDGNVPRWGDSVRVVGVPGVYVCVLSYCWCHLCTVNGPRAMESRGQRFNGVVKRRMASMSMPTTLPSAPKPSVALVHSSRFLVLLLYAVVCTIALERTVYHSVSMCEYVSA